MREEVSGDVSLFEMCKLGQLAEIEKLLCTSCINVHAVDECGRTLLHYAARYGHHTLVSLLLLHKVGVNEQDKEHKTALHLATRVEGIDMKVIEQLTSIPNVDLDVLDTYGMSSQHYACHYNDTSIVKVLLDQHASIHTIDAFDMTPLHYAVNCGKLDMVQLLLLHNSNLNQQDSDGCTPLYYAAFQQHIEMLEYLLSLDVHVDIQDNSDQTALHSVIISQGNIMQNNPKVITIVNLLLHNKADPTIATENQVTPLMTATSLQHPERVMEALINSLT